MAAASVGSDRPGFAYAGTGCFVQEFERSWYGSPVARVIPIPHVWLLEA